MSNEEFKEVKLASSFETEGGLKKILKSTIKHKSVFETTTADAETNNEPSMKVGTTTNDAAQQKS